MRHKTATIRDVAKRAGVAISTVSYVLNGKDDHVGPDTRAQIMAAARDLNYRPNAIARSMVKQQTATIGLVITELDNPLFVPVTEGVEEILRTEGYQMLLASAYDLESEVEAVEAFRAHQVAGIIFMSLSVYYPIDHLLQLYEEGVPFVVINRDLDDERFNRIELDDYGAAYAAVEHLVEIGHKAIGTISGPLGGGPGIRRRSAIERQDGWQAALAQHGLAANPSWTVSGSYTYEGGYQGMKRLLAGLNGGERPTALFVASDVMAVGALKAIYEAGLRVPDDLAIITVGDPPFAAYTIPALTTMSTPIVEAGRVAAHTILNQIGHQNPLQPACIRLNYSLLVRESTDARRAL